MATPRPRFRPSAASLTPRKQALQALGYCKAAIERLEQYLNEVTDENEVPAWVLTRINQGASSLGVAVSFVMFRNKEKEERKS